MTKIISKQGQDEEHVWNAISAIHQIANNDYQTVTLEEAVAQLRQELLSHSGQQENQSKSLLRMFKAAVVHKLPGSPPGVEACIEWLRKTGQFNEKELRRIRRIRLLQEDSPGNLAINEKILSIGTATVLLGLVFLVAGIWIGWIVFGTKGDIQGIVDSFALGMILGSIASYILDKSFRFQQIKSKVELVAPWFIRTG